MWINGGFYTLYQPDFPQYEVNINFRLTGCYPPESLYFLPEINSPKLSCMRWESVTANSNNEIYQLYKDDKKILTVILNPFSNSARVECEKEKRVFLIRKEGFRRNKTVLRSEYGIKIGELGQENKENFIDVNNERFFYATQNNPLAELVLYKESKDKPFVTCGLNAKEGTASVHFTKDKQLSGTSHPGLLMALCWYMFLPVTKENVVEFAV